MLKYGSVLYNKSFKIEETFEDTVIKPTFIQMREMLARFVRVSLQRFLLFFSSQKIRHQESESHISQTRVGL